jgi:hypothetical protein
MLTTAIDSDICRGCGDYLFALENAIDASAQARGYCCTTCEDENRPPTLGERFTMPARRLAQALVNAARGARRTARGVYYLVTDTRGCRRRLSVRTVMHRGRLDRSWCWCVMFGTLAHSETGQPFSGAGVIGGFTFYVARRCYFQPRGDCRTKFAHIGLTMDGNGTPLTRG